MHEKVNKLLLVRDIFMHEVHSRQPGFTCSTCKVFNKNKERIEKFNGRFTIFLSKRTR